MIYRITITGKVFRFLIAWLLVVLVACSTRKNKVLDTSRDAIYQKVSKLSTQRTEAIINDNLKSFLSFYDNSAISMPEYQPLLKGKYEIETFYKEIFERQNIKNFEKKIDEIITIDSTIVEIGTFTKEFTTPHVDTIVAQNGKYWNVWEVKTDGNFPLKGEAYGFFSSIIDIKALIVPFPKEQLNESADAPSEDIPFELKAYNALNEKYVHIRDGATRSEFYTSDARIFPFADSTVSGCGIRPITFFCLTLDSVAVYTDRFKKFYDGYLEYFRFKVRWRTQEASGRTEGKGIRIWKRQPDGALKNAP